MMFEKSTQKELERLLVPSALLNVYVMRVLLLALKPGRKHLSGKKSFGHKCIKEMESLYCKGEHALQRSILALERCLAIDAWETAVSLRGLGSNSDPNRLSLEWHLVKAKETAWKVQALYEQGKTYKDWYEASPEGSCVCEKKT